MQKYHSIPNVGVTLRGGLVKIVVDNINYDRCEKAIIEALIDLDLYAIKIHFEQNIVVFKNPQNEDLILKAINKLYELGFPLVDTDEGLMDLALRTKKNIDSSETKVS